MQGAPKGPAQSEAGDVFDAWVPPVVHLLDHRSKSDDNNNNC